MLLYAAGQGGSLGLNSRQRSYAQRWRSSRKRYGVTVLRQYLHLQLMDSYLVMQDGGTRYSVKNVSFLTCTMMADNQINKFRGNGLSKEARWKLAPF